MLTKSVVVVFLGIIYGLAVLNLFWDAPALLVSERRMREQLPKFSFDFMEGFEGYAADRFPFRDGFRALQAAVVFGAFLQTDNDGIYFDSHGVGSFTALDMESAKLLVEKIRVVSDGLPDMNTFFAVVPDKSVFSDRAMPGFDYDLVRDFTSVSLIDALSADSFYRTDLHWCQVSIDGVVDALGDAMGFRVDFGEFTRRYAGQFHGGYAGQVALPVRGEPLYFLELPGLRAYYMNMGTREFEEGPVYDLARFGGIDPYDIFLSGAQPLIVLENDNAPADRVLYIFRDSFGSSIAPVLAAAYSRVVLVDFRFIDLRTLHTLIDFTPGADALFLYSAGILNNAEMLMIPRE